MEDAIAQEKQRLSARQDQLDQEKQRLDQEQKEILSMSEGPERVQRLQLLLSDKAVLVSAMAALTSDKAAHAAAVQAFYKQQRGPSQALATSSPCRPNLMQCLEKLAHELLAAEPFKDKLVLLSLLENPEIEIESPIFQSVYMRPEYRSLLDCIKKQKCLRSLVISGTPGIGKSAFVVPLVSFLAKERRRVYYRFHEPRHGLDAAVVLDFRDADHGKIRVDFALGSELERLQAVLGAAGTVVLYDGAAPRSAYNGTATSRDDRGKQAVIIVMTSPNMENWHQFSKGRSVDLLYINPWRLSELEECRKGLYSDVTANMMRERYRLFGGVIRDVLANQHYTFAKLKEKVGMDHVRSLSSLNLVGTRSDVCHMLAHIRAIDFRFRGFTFASPEVAKLVFGMLLEDAQRQVKTMMAAAAGHSGTAGFRGMVFEQHGHMVVPAGAKVLMRCLSGAGKRQRSPAGMGGSHAGPSASRRKVEEDGDGGGGGSAEERELEDSCSHHWGPDLEEAAAPHGGEEGEKCEEDKQGQGPGAAGAVQQQFAGLQLGGGGDQQRTGDDEVHLSRVQHMWDAPGMDLKKLVDGGGGFYLQPPNTNNPAWDAVYCSDEYTLIMQYTVSAKHGVRARPLVDLLGRMGVGAAQVRLVFVVPAEPLELYDMFKAQPLLGVNGKVLKQAPAKLSGLQQWVMQLSLSASGPNSRGSSGGGSIPPGGGGS